MNLDLYNDTYQQYCELLSKPDARILEIGCGPGNITRQILNLNSKLNVLATDVSVKMIELTKKNNPTVKTQVLDCREIKSIQHKFDGIICGFTIPYLEKPDVIKLIRNSSQLLRKKGTLYISFVVGNYLNSGFISESFEKRTYFYYYDLNTIEEILKLNNLFITNNYEKAYIKTDGSTENHVIIIAQAI